jgi:hypothetical protein
MTIELSPYQWKLELPSYTNNEEYRKTLRLLFRMNNAQYEEKIQELHDHLGDDLDSETKDENEFDEISTSAAMDYIFEKTKDVGIFKIIYQMAAAKMMSEDHQIGLAVCFSYDYLGTFHECIKEFMTNPELYTSESQSCQTMHTKL